VEEHFREWLKFISGIATNWPQKVTKLDRAVSQTGANFKTEATF
jgi:hypothetical protein